MNSNNNINVIEANRDMMRDIQSTEPEAPPATGVHEQGITVGWILSRIDMIIRDSEYLHNAVSALTSGFPMNESPEGGKGDAARASAVMNIVEAREKTNQQILSMLKEMLASVSPLKTAEDKSLEAQYRLRMNMTDAIGQKIAGLDTDTDGSYDTLCALRDMMNDLIK